MQIELNIKTLEDNAELKVRDKTILAILKRLPDYADFFKVGYFAASGSTKLRIIEMNQWQIFTLGFIAGTLWCLAIYHFVSWYVWKDFGK